jgi:alpha-L-fucosidase 2
MRVPEIPGGLPGFRDRAAENPLCLRYDQPAGEWTEALPIGNGSLGAMIFGGVDRDRLQLNADTLWSGFPNDIQPQPGPDVLSEIRRLVMNEQRYVEADQLAKQFQGSFAAVYVPLADVILELDHSAEAGEYRRELDLATALARVTYTANGTRFTREVFASAVHNVIVVRLTCALPRHITCRVRMQSPLQSSVHTVGSNGLAVRGKAPSHVVPHHLESDQPVVYDAAEGRGMRFEARVVALVDDGRLVVDDSSLRIERATAVTLLIAAATGYRGFGQPPDRPAAEIGEDVERQVVATATASYDELRTAHMNDYRRLFGSLELNLGGVPEADRPTDERLRSPEAATDPHLAALFLQYGRYLLIASSRPGTQPANLQGIWNDQVRQIWGSDWTVNINLQMNYWLAETANLSECHEPLFDLIADLSSSGRAAASQTYGSRGWTLHNGTDLWRSVRSGGDGFSSPDWSMWPMGGVWLCQHLWEHVAFSGDLTFLRDRAYAVMKAAAEFCLDWLIGNDDGYLVTCPSTSPENQFLTADGEHAAVSMASTMDLMLIWDLFTNCIDAANLLAIDEPFVAQLQAARARLLPLQIGRHGQLQEWSVDFDEFEPGHRHLSHLFGLHPGRQITPRGTPELAEAARRSLERRLTHGGGHTGWSRAWVVNQWARLGEGDQAHAHLQALLKSSTLPNLLSTHPPFQIDANFGGAAGILEMLLQSHSGVLELLPALPGAWPEGSARGLRARGGFTVGIEWNSGRLVRATIVADRDGPCRVLYARAPLTTLNGHPVAAATRLHNTQPIEFYALCGQPAVLVPAEDSV